MNYWTRGGRVTHFSRYSRTTSDAVLPSSAALDWTAVHSSSLMRMFRSVVPRGMSAALERLDALPAQLGHRAGRQDRVGGGGDAEKLDVAVGAPGELVAVHSSSVPTPVGTRKWVTA